MNVSLTSELENYIQEKVDSKMYQTASEVVREALRLLKQRDEVEEDFESLRADIQKALVKSRAGKSRLITDKAALLKEIEAGGRKRLEARKAAK
jgi:antitoxin ParD1/3/4